MHDMDTFGILLCGDAQNRTEVLPVPRAVFPTIDTISSPLGNGSS